LRSFPILLTIPVAWGEMDALGHVNNVAYFRYFESARVAYLERISFLSDPQQPTIGAILASTQCRYRAPLTYPDQLYVGARVGQIEADRFTMDYGIISTRLNRVAAEGSAVVVSYDYRVGQKAPLPSDVRRRIESLESRGTGELRLP
jgi:acyl-CoA thioester hydrolase